MAHSRKLKELTLQELQTMQKRYRAFVTILCITTLLTLIFLMYFVIKNNNYIFLTLSGGSSFALLLCSVNLRQLEKEIACREE